MINPRRQRYEMCGKKRRYYDRRHAHIAANSATERSGKTHRVYRCEYGDHFHITSKDKQKETP